jgi:hypothetical protein
VVLKDYVSGKLLFCHLRPDYDEAVHGVFEQCGRYKNKIIEESEDSDDDDEGEEIKKVDEVDEGDEDEEEEDDEDNEDDDDDEDEEDKDEEDKVEIDTTNEKIVKVEVDAAETLKIQ